jgi:hypothetical protein
VGVVVFEVKGSGGLRGGFGFPWCCCAVFGWDSLIERWRILNGLLFIFYDFKFKVEIVSPFFSAHFGSEF